MAKIVCVCGAVHEVVLGAHPTPSAFVRETCGGCGHPFLAQSLSAVHAMIQDHAAAAKAGEIACAAPLVP
jgi:hypothetical protein